MTTTFRVQGANPGHGESLTTGAEQSRNPIIRSAIIEGKLHV